MRLYMRLRRWVVRRLDDGLSDALVDLDPERPIELLAKFVDVAKPCGGELGSSQHEAGRLKAH
jgi:hypothetical protein